MHWLASFFFYFYRMHARMKILMKFRYILFGVVFIEIDVGDRDYYSYFFS